MRNPTLICSDDCIDPWGAGASMQIQVPVTPAPGRTLLGSWSSFVLTVRTDPSWPRAGSQVYDLVDLSNFPTWAIAVQANGVPDPNGGNFVTFTVTAPTLPGDRRYIIDVVGQGGSAGLTPFVKPTWLSVYGL